MARTRHTSSDAPPAATGIMPAAPEVAEEIPAELQELKACPKCGGEAAAGKDKHGLWRCACKECGYWDAMVYNSEAQARVGWQGCGDPLAVE